MTENKPLALPLPYKEKIIYTLAMNVRELVTLTMDGTAAPEETLPEMDYNLQALQQVHFSPTSPEPLPKEEKEEEEVSGPVVLKIVSAILNDGWIAQDKSGAWFYYSSEPKIYSEINRWDTDNGDWVALSPFKLPRFSDWKESLYQIKKGKLIKCQNVKSK